MELIRFYIRKFLKIIKNEVLVLPSRIVVFLFFLLLILLPLFTKDPYLLRILIMTSIFAILAASWDLLSGFTGQLNFGHALFFGVGAYAAAMLNLNAHIPPWGSIPLGALFAVLAGLIIGIPCLRLRGTYLALTTLAFPIILMGIVFAIPDITGGELGISGLERLARSRVANYYITVVVMLVLCTAMWKITDSNIGIIFHAIREDELAVRAAGINTTYYKLLAFCLSGFFAGISGGALRSFYEDRRPIDSDGVYVLYGSDLVHFWRRCHDLGAYRRRFHPFSFNGVLPVMAGVPYVNVCFCYIVDSSLYAGGIAPMDPRQN